jgi:hypothetical protein
MLARSARARKKIWFDVLNISVLALLARKSYDVCPGRANPVN